MQAEDISEVRYYKGGVNLYVRLVHTVENPHSPAEAIIQTAIDYIAYLPTDIAASVRILEKDPFISLPSHGIFSKLQMHIPKISLSINIKNSNVLKMRNASDFYSNGFIENVLKLHLGWKMLVVLVNLWTPA